MRDTNIFPNMVVQMVAIGEESGALDAMLSKVADWYEQEVDDAVDALTSLLETADHGGVGGHHRRPRDCHVSADFQDGSGRLIIVYTQQPTPHKLALQV